MHGYLLHVADWDGDTQPDLVLGTPNCWDNTCFSEAATVLTAVGLASQPIVFTTVHDDTVGRFREAGLTPVDASQVPVVPEPAALSGLRLAVPQTLVLDGTLNASVNPGTLPALES